MCRRWGRARRCAILILMATVEARAALFVGFSDDRLVEVVVRFGVFILVLVVVVGSRGGRIVLPMTVTACQSTNKDDDLSGMRRVTSSSYRMLRHSRRMLPRELPLGKACASLSDQRGGKRRARNQRSDTAAPKRPRVEASFKNHQRAANVAKLVRRI